MFWGEKQSLMKTVSKLFLIHHNSTPFLLCHFLRAEITVEFVKLIHDCVKMQRCSCVVVLVSSPSGGCSMPPFFSQLPIGWISEESTRRQKSFLLSDPSRRSRSREPVKPTTVAMQVDVVFRGSWASSFMPALNSFTGGVRLWTVMIVKIWRKKKEKGMKTYKNDTLQSAMNLHTCLKHEAGAAIVSVSFRYFSQLKCPVE